MSASKNVNIVSASASPNNHGLLEVVFSCRGNPEYPTSLNPNLTLFDEPIYAFRLGEETSRRSPRYLYTKYQLAERQFDCISVLYRDGSVYKPYEDAREITLHDKLRIYNAYSNVDQYGLRHVFFEGVGLIGNKPIYPTALTAGRTLEENALDAFWGGEKGLNLSANFTGYDEAEGWFWRTETVLNADGSAIDENGGLVLQYSDYVNYTLPGKADLSSAQGFRTLPATGTSLKAVIKFYILKENAEGVASGEPIRILQWAGGSYRGSIDEQDGILVAKSEGFSGCLAGVTNLVITNGEFLGRDAYAVAGSLSSVPTYSDWTRLCKKGAILTRESSLIFSTAEGVKYFIQKDAILDEDIYGSSEESETTE